MSSDRPAFGTFGSYRPGPRVLAQQDLPPYPPDFRPALLPSPWLTRAIRSTAPFWRIRFPPLLPLSPLLEVSVERFQNPCLVNLRQTFPR